MKLIYLAGPYSHPSTEEMERRFETHVKVAAILMNKQLFIYSPIVHNHPIAVRYSLPRGFEYWRDFDLLLLAKCDEMYVIKMEGWDKSVGVAGEIAFAETQLKLPINYITEQGEIDHG